MFDDVCNFERLQESVLFVLFSKVDLFGEKIRKVSISTCPSFAGFAEAGYDPALQFIQKAFTCLDRRRNKRMIYFYRMTMLDTDRVSRVFADITGVFGDIAGPLLTHQMIVDGEEEAYEACDDDEEKEESDLARSIRSTFSNQCI